MISGTYSRRHGCSVRVQHPVCWEAFDVHRKQPTPKYISHACRFSQPAPPSAVLSELFRPSLRTEREDDDEIGAVGSVTTSSGVTVSFSISQKLCYEPACFRSQKSPELRWLYAELPSRALAPIDGRKREPDRQYLKLLNRGSSILAACDEA